ncbi:MAG TPA: flagellar basal body-associated FliL family protein [Alphaproteobacteria bacterium]|nr:flagellar basal body-associated FliL family protein [Alphaproteobacteria bacterium]
MAQAAAALKKPAPVEADEVDDEVDASPEPEARRFGGKKIVLFIVLPLVVLIAAAVAVLTTGVADNLLGRGDASERPAPMKPAVFFDMPELLVNLNSGGRRVTFLKLSISLELNDQQDIPKVQLMLPRLVDNFQVYLRELRLEDLRGSAGVYRLREDLLARVNEAAKPVKVKDVLFREMLVQ